MAYIDRQHKNRHRDFQVRRLLTSAETALATPDLDLLDLPAGAHEAIERCNEALLINPNSGEAYHIRARAYELTGNLEKAKQDRSRAKALGYRLSSAKDAEHAD